MDTVGRAALVLALAVALYGIGAALYGARTGRRAWVDSARRSVYAVGALGVLSFAILEVAFLRDDFSFNVVASHSSTTTPTHFKVGAAWSSQEGSLLLWLTLLGVWSSLVVFLTRRRLRDVQPYAVAVLLGFAAFFAFLLVALESPFTRVAVAPAEGVGLMPLLRHPSMLSHPLFLYSGYTLFAVPFAFAVGALVVRRIDAEWIAATRRFTLAAWLMLGIGIFLGARWSYAELGWGGYWAWDPVENASLLPWLTGTAFLHSVMLQERRGMLKVWNASLILATGTLAILGTFLVRSGILDSIHAFGASTLGVPFVLLIASLIVGSVVLVTSRLDVLRSEHRLDALLSREAVFLFQNLVLTAMAFVIGFLTFFPLIAEAVTGTKRAIGPPMYDTFVVPLTLVLVLLAGIGPLIAWRRATWASLRRAFLWPAVAGVTVLAVAAGAAGAASKPLALLMFGLGAFVVAGVAQELGRGARARRAMTGEAPPLAALSLVRRNRRRYGGYTVHVGMIVLFVGVAASSAFQDERDVSLAPGQSAVVDGYRITYAEPTAGFDVLEGRPERIRLGARLQVTKDGKDLGTLTTERGYYPSSDPTLGPVGRYFEGESTSEIGLRAGLLHDLWTAVAPDQQAIKAVVDATDARLADATAEQALTAAVKFADVYRQSKTAAQFRVISSPMVSWVWLGGICAFLGGIFALWPAPSAARRRAAVGARVPVAGEAT